MKTIISSVPRLLVPVPTLPALFRARATEIIVLFTELERGTVLVVPLNTPGMYVGRETNFTACNKTDVWDLLPSGFEIKHVQE